MLTLWVVIITSTIHFLAGSQHCCNNEDTGNGRFPWVVNLVNRLSLSLSSYM